MLGRCVHTTLSGHLQKQCTLSTSMCEASPKCSTTPALGIQQNRAISQAVQGSVEETGMATNKESGALEPGGAWLIPAKAVGDAWAEQVSSMHHPNPSRGNSVNRGCTEDVEHCGTSVPPEAQFSSKREFHELSGLEFSKIIPHAQKA